MARSLEVHMGFLHYCTFGLEAADDAQNIRASSGRWNNDQQKLSKWKCDIVAYKSLQMYEKTNNPVYKLMTDCLQLVLINVLIRTIFDN